jgi:hypothetical protein
MATRTKQLFTVPIKKIRLDESAELKQEFLPAILQRYEAGLYDRPRDWKTDRIHTSYNAPHDEHPIQTMPAAYDRLLKSLIPPTEFRIQLWHNVYWKGEEYQEIHHHVPCHLSFIHFLSFDKNEHKPPIFYDPARIIKGHCRREGLPSEYWQDRVVIDVEEGDVIVFPSYVEHYIPPGVYRSPRVTVSMNLTFDRKS